MKGSVCAGWTPQSAMPGMDRSLRHHVAFTTVAVSVLALSVGVATLLFALFDGVLLRPLPYREPGRLVRVFDSSATRRRIPMAIARYQEFRAAAQSLDGLALYTGRDLELGGEGRRSTRVTGVAVTTDFFSILGWTPASGHAFTDSDLRRSVRNVILSERLWRMRFDADPGIVGIDHPARSRAVDRRRRDASRLPARRRRVPVAAAGRHRGRLRLPLTDRRRRRGPARLALLQRDRQGPQPDNRLGEAQQELATLSADLLARVQPLRDVGRAHRAPARRGHGPFTLRGDLAGARGSTGARRGVREHRRALRGPGADATARRCGAACARRQSLAADSRGAGREPR